MRVRSLLFAHLSSISGGSQGLKLPQMKRLYCQLNYLSLKTPMCFAEHAASSNGLDMEFSEEGCEVLYTDLRMISDILFRELDKKFECYFSALLGDYVTQADGQAALHFDISTATEELPLLLRCCMVILTLSASDQIALMKNCRVLLSVLGTIFSLYVNEGNKVNSISLKMKSASPYLCTLLEVFMDELLTHKSLREYLMLVDSTSFSSEMLFAPHFNPGDIGTVLEVICYHFTLSIPDEEAFEDFLKQLFWKQSIGSKVPELSLAAALSLLQHPIVLSAPIMFQVYLILLVSESINGGLSFESLRPVPSLMGLYLMAFEKSVILYSRFFHGLRNDNRLLDANCPFSKPSTLGRSSHPSFEYYVKEDSRDKIYNVVSRFNDLFDSGLCNKFVRTKSELVALSIAYMEENQHAVDELCRDKVLSIMRCIIHRASDDGANNAELCGVLDISPQETCLLGAILKLMSGSLLQAVLCTRHSEKKSGLETSKDSSLCDEYVFIMKIAGCFQDFKACLPIQKFLCDMIKGQRMKHKEFKWILCHFSGLLSLSLVRGLDFIVKNCIFMIMTLLNLLSRIEDDLAVLLLGCESESCLRTVSPVHVHEQAKSSSKTTRKVASNFLRVRKVHLSTNSLNNCRQNRQAKTSENISIVDENESVVAEEGQTETACNGKSFLKCLTDKSLDIDDLADFVECKKERDYTGWLKIRQKYRTWKERKRAGCRLNRMKRMRSFLKGK